MRIKHTERWTVRQDYSIQGERLCGVGNHSYSYNPIQETDIPTKMGNLQEGDVESLIQFAKVYGEFGYRYLRKHADQCGEPLEWIWIHTQTIKLCLKLKEYFEELEEWQIDDYLNRYRIQDCQYDKCVYKLNIADKADIISTKYIRRSQESSREIAKQIYEDIIHRNICEIDYNQRIVDNTAQPQLVFYGLIEVAYWHLNSAKQKYVKRCQSCDLFFIAENRKQKFCPHPQDPSKPSLCGANARQAKRRERKRSQA